MIKSILVFSLLVLPYSTPAGPAEDLQKKIEVVSYTLNIEICYDAHVDDSWECVVYDLCDERALSKYLDLLLKAYCKYPDGYLSKTGIKRLVLTKNLKFNDQERAAVPDPYKNQLYLSVNGAYGVASACYLVHVMHHELHHCTEFALWKNMTYDWCDWIMLNTTGFSYGNGGATAYKDALERKIDVYSATNPQKGFINLYSLTGDEEDRAELLAYLLTDFERPKLQAVLPKDEILRRKIETLQNLLNTFSGEPFLVLP